MADYEPKSEGITYLRHAVRQQKKRKVGKFITLSMEQAEKIVQQAEGFVPRNAGYDPRRNSERAASLILGVDVKELCKRLEAPDTSKILNDLAEARNYIKMLEVAGDQMDKFSTHSISKSNWANARKFKP